MVSSSTIDKMFEITLFTKLQVRNFLKKAGFVPMFVKSVDFLPIFIKSVNFEHFVNGR